MYDIFNVLVWYKRVKVSRCKNKIQNKLLSAVYPVGALPAPLVRLLQHPDDGDAVLLPGVGQGRHPLGVL